MRKHWLVSAAAALAAAAAGVSYASFATTDVIGGSAASGGSLTIELKSGGTQDASWDGIGPLTPQRDGTPESVIRRVRVTNTGTVTAALSFQALALADSEGDCPPPEKAAERGDCGQTGELSQQLQVEVFRMTEGWDRQTRIGLLSLGDLAKAEQDGGLPVSKGETARLQFEFSLPEHPRTGPTGAALTEPVSNAVQGDTATFQMRFSLRSV